MKDGSSVSAPRRAVLLRSRRESQEHLPAPRARDLLSPGPILADHDRRLPGLNLLPLPRCRTLGIAGVARRDKVRRIVVLVVPVQMIDQEAPSRSGTASRYPSHPGTAPVAVVRARPDLVVEIEPTDSHDPRRGRERMASSGPHSRSLHRGLARPNGSESVVAVQRAELACPTVALRLEGDTTRLALSHCKTH